MYSKENIVDWLKAIGAEASAVKESGTEWLIQGNQNRQSFAVVRVETEDRIIIQKAMTFSKQHMENQISAKEKTRSDFLNDLKRDLLLSHARFRIDPDPDDPTITKRMITEAYIYDDGATKDNFFRAYFDVIDASFLCVIQVERHFG